MMHGQTQIKYTVVYFTVSGFQVGYGYGPSDGFNE
jgi:hypothetical protein